MIALKQELRKRNAKLSGRKSELVERLEAYDRLAAGAVFRVRAIKNSELSLRRLTKSW